MMLMMMRVGMMITMMMMMKMMILVQLLTYHISTTCYLADRTPCFVFARAYAVRWGVYYTIIVACVGDIGKRFGFRLNEQPT